MKIVARGSRLKQRLVKEYVLRRYTAKAHGLREKVVSRLGRQIVSVPLEKEIKKYSKATFGSSSYWPWLALYAEIKGVFVPGWVPNDFFQVEILGKWNPKRSAEVSNMKTFYHRYLGDFAIKPVAVRVSGCYFDECGNVLSEQEVLEKAMSSAEEVVVKRNGGLAGAGIEFLKSVDIDMARLGKIEGDFVIQEVCRQHADFSRWHVESLNTLRVATFLGSDGAVSVKFVFLRWGMRGNRVDNTSLGGRLVFFNHDGEAITGVMDSAAIDVSGEDPELAKSLTELKLPFVGQAIGKCSEAHRSFPYVRYIAWDVFVNEDGEAKMVEWNAVKPGMWFAEPHIGPIWDLDSVFKECRG